MPFVKLDCNMINSTLWFERLQREIFITALLMAEPIWVKEPRAQIKVRSLDKTGWEVPPDLKRQYGFVPAAGVGIVRFAMTSNDPAEIERGLDALEKLGEPEEASRTPEFDGRRLVRVDGGYIVLNYGKYRDKDYTSAERSRRYRERKARNGRHTVASHNHAVTSRSITQAEAYKERKETKERMQKQSVVSAVAADSEEEWRGQPKSEAEREAVYKKVAEETRKLVQKLKAPL